MKEITAESFNQTLQSYLGLLKHANSRRVVKKLESLAGFKSLEEIEGLYLKRSTMSKKHALLSHQEFRNFSVRKIRISSKPPGRDKSRISSRRTVPVVQTVTT